MSEGDLVNADNATAAAKQLLENTLVNADAIKTESDRAKEAESLKAPIASPIFTGSPKAPTPDTSANDLRIATTAFVKAVINALIGGAPETLDTLKEIADAIEEHKEVTDALDAAIGRKVDKVAGKGLSTNDFTAALLAKLNGIAAGAEVNVQPDWDVTDANSDAFVKNKPTIPTKTSQLTNDSNFLKALDIGTVIAGQVIFGSIESSVVSPELAQYGITADMTANEVWRKLPKNSVTYINSNTQNNTWSLSLPISSRNCVVFYQSGGRGYGQLFPYDDKLNVYHVNVLDNTFGTWQQHTNTRVKGSAESSYRTGDVNLTPANIGAYPQFFVTTATNFDTVRTTGIYHIKVGGCTGLPISYWGTVIVDWEVGTKYQMFIPDGEVAAVYKRKGDDKSWGNWINLNEQAIKDGNGNVIADTYTTLDKFRNVFKMGDQVGTLKDLVEKVLIGPDTSIRSKSGNFKTTTKILPWEVSAGDGWMQFIATWQNHWNQNNYDLGLNVMIYDAANCVLHWVLINGKNGSYKISKNYVIAFNKSVQDFYNEAVNTLSSKISTGTSVVITDYDWIFLMRPSAVSGAGTKANPYQTRADEFWKYIQKKIQSEYAPFKFGVDSNGNYGYKKAGADAVTPFLSPVSIHTGNTYAKFTDTLTSIDLNYYLLKPGSPFYILLPNGPGISPSLYLRTDFDDRKTHFANKISSLNISDDGGIWNNLYRIFNSCAIYSAYVYNEVTNGSVTNPVETKLYGIKSNYGCLIHGIIYFPKNTVVNGHSDMYNDAPLVACI